MRGFRRSERSERAARPSASGSPRSCLTSGTRKSLRLGVLAVLRMRPRGGAAAVHPQHAEHGAERDLAEPADRRQAQRLLELRDLVGDVLDALALLDQLVEDRVRLRRAHPAWDALPARLVAEEAQDVRPGGQQIRPFGHDDQRARAEHRAGLLQRLPVQRHVELVWSEEVRRGATGLDRRDLAAAGHAARELDQLTRGRARAHAVDVRPLDVAGHREELQAGRAVDALLLPPVRAALEEDRNVGERLDRVHQRGLAVQAVQARERRLVAGLAAVALHALEQRGLLAEYVAAGRGEDLDAEALAQE